MSLSEQIRLSSLCRPGDAKERAQERLGHSCLVVEGVREKVGRGGHKFSGEVPHMEMSEERAHFLNIYMSFDIKNALTSCSKVNLL